MKPHDLAILAGVGLVAVLAAADGFRARHETEPSRPRPSRDRASLVAAPAADPLRPGVLPGRLVFTDAECAVRVVDLARVRQAAARREGSCGLWGPQHGDRFAYGVDADRAGDRPSRALAFRIGAVEDSGYDAGLHHGVPASIRWSPDGRRLAWCDHYGTPVELEVAGPTRRRLPTCPVGYTTAGERAYAAGDRIVAGGRTVVVTGGPASVANFAQNGTVGVVTQREIVVFRDGEARATVPRPRSRGAPLLAPNNCAALVRSPHDAGAPRITLVPLGCVPLRRARAFAGSDAAWSPGGDWIAVADDGGVTFFPVSPGARPLRLAVRAHNLLWKEGG